MKKTQKSNKKTTQKKDDSITSKIPITHETPKVSEPKKIAYDPDMTQTGIEGFDELTEGGFPKSAKILVEGKPGTGKTIFALQYLYNGATKYNEKGLYLTFEQSGEKLKKQAKKFGWDLDAAGITIIYKSASNVHSVHEILQRVYDTVEKNGIKRLVIDSLPALYINAVNVMGEKDVDTTNFKKAITIFKSTPKEDHRISPKRFMYNLLDLLQCVPITTLLITESIESQPEFGYTPEYVSEGCVNLTFEVVGNEVKRFLTVRKMRYQNNNLTSQEFSIIPKQGITMSTLN